MSDPQPAPAAGAAGLDFNAMSSTKWSLLNTDQRELLIHRYRLAIRSYLEKLLRDENAVEDVAQQFMIKMVRDGFAGADPAKGRLRDYLKQALRHEVRNYWRRERRRTLRDRLAGLAFWSRKGGGTAAPLDAAREVQLSGDTSEQWWRADWREAILGQTLRALKALQEYQEHFAGNLYFTVLQLLVAHPEASAEELAGRLSDQTGQPYHADGVRKILSRMRRKLAEFLLAEVRQTLDDPTPEQVEDELHELELMAHIRRYLPPDWRERGRLVDAE